MLAAYTCSRGGWGGLIKMPEAHTKKGRISSLQKRTLYSCLQREPCRLSQVLSLGGGDDLCNPESIKVSQAHFRTLYHLALS